ncbi:MAG: hypothetical protein KAI79_16275 [Bacteroidales bacterium]|nr:hypothetical protein [Bacteroidales bacterium]
MKFFFEKKQIEKSWIDNFCFDNWHQCVRYQKEEQGIYHPDNMMPNGNINNKL